MKENSSKRPPPPATVGAIMPLSVLSRKRQKILLSLAFTALAVGFPAGSTRAAEPVIGILPKTIIGDVFMKNMSDAAVAKGKALEAKVEVYSVPSHEAVEEQVSAVESLISRKVDAIILAAVDSKGLSPVVDKATAAGIPGHPGRFWHGHVPVDGDDGSSQGSLEIGMLIAIATGVLVGLLNGTLVAFLGLPPFIITLG